MNPNPTIIGAAVALVVAIGGWVVSNRGQKTDSASNLVNAALAIAERHSEDEHDCRSRLDAMSLRVDGLAEKLDECNEKHDRAERALVNAGIVVSD